MVLPKGGLMSARYGVIAQLREENATQQPVEHLMRDGEPIWDAIEFDVLCSRCDYNLRMLPKPRCPECGLEFDWDIVLNEAAWKSDFLFEHHWHTRPIHSWLKTMRHSLRPIKFWKSVSIHDRIHPGPLWFLLMTSVLWWHVTFFGLAWLTATAIGAVMNYGFWQPSTGVTNSPVYSLAVVLGGLSSIAFQERGASFPAMMFLTIFGALLLICTLRQTLGRCKVRLVQILRVVAYVSTPFVLLMALMMLAVTVAQILSGVQDWLVVTLALFVPTCFVGLLGFYIGAGLKHYLRLPHAYATGVIAAFTGGLFGVTILAVVTVGW